MNDFEPNRRRRRRWTARVALIVLLVALPLVLRTVREAERGAVPPPLRVTPPGAPPLYGDDRAGPGSVPANPDRPPTIPLEVAPLPPPLVEPQPAPPAAPLGAPAPPPAAAAPEPTVEAPPETALALAAAGGPGSTSELAVDQSPRIYVHPDPQAKIVAKRKIDADVILTTRVGGDGRVQEVRVEQGISNCGECTASAIEAARRFVFDAPVLPPGSNGVWIRVTLHFGRGR